MHEDLYGYESPVVHGCITFKGNKHTNRFETIIDLKRNCWPTQVLCPALPGRIISGTSPLSVFQPARPPRVCCPSSAQAPMDQGAPAAPWVKSPLVEDPVSSEVRKACEAHCLAAQII